MRQELSKQREHYPQLNHDGVLQAAALPGHFGRFIARKETSTKAAAPTAAQRRAAYIAFELQADELFNPADYAQHAGLAIRRYNRGTRTRKEALADAMIDVADSEANVRVCTFAVPSWTDATRTAHGPGTVQELTHQIALLQAYAGYEDALAQLVSLQQDRPAERVKSIDKASELRIMQTIGR